MEFYSQEDVSFPYKYEHVVQLVHSDRLAEAEMMLRFRTNRGWD